MQALWKLVLTQHCWHYVSLATWPCHLELQQQQPFVLEMWDFFLSYLQHLLSRSFPTNPVVLGPKRTHNLSSSNLFIPQSRAIPVHPHRQLWKVTCYQSASLISGYHLDLDLPVSIIFLSTVCNQVIDQCGTSGHFCIHQHIHIIQASCGTGNAVGLESFVVQMLGAGNPAAAKRTGKQTVCFLD